MKTTTATKNSTTNTATKSSTGNGTNGTAQANRTSASGTSKSQEQTPFEKLFEDLLKDIYWAEQNLVPALKKMHEAATTEELQSAFEDHLYVTQKHVSRLEKVFSLLGKKPEAEKCDAMAGLLKEADRVISETKEGTMTRDAGLIIAAQKVEHYEIAAYGSLVQVALTLGNDQAASILEKTLWEEEDTDQLLTTIAESDVNPMADEEDTDVTAEKEAETAEA